MSPLWGDISFWSSPRGRESKRAPASHVRRALKLGAAVRGTAAFARGDSRCTRRLDGGACKLHRRTTERARETRLRFPLHTFPSLRPEEIPAAEAAGKRARAGAPSWGFPARFFGNTQSYSRRVLYFSSAAMNRSRLPTVNRRFSCPCRRASSSVQGDGLTGNTPDTPAA